MNSAHSFSKEETPLEDVDRNSMEYRVLMAYAQHRLSASEYGQLLQREAKGPEGSSLSSEYMKAVRPASKEKTQDLSSEDQEQPSQKRSKKKKKEKKKKKKKKSKWERFLFPSCLKVQTREEPRQPTSERNGFVLRFEEGVGSEPSLTQEMKDDLSITLVADRLAEIVDNSESVEERCLSIEEDGGQTSFEEEEKDNEDKIIETIVALLRKSGDELQKKMQMDKSFSQRVSDLMSYAFFRRVADQFLEEAPVCSTMDSEVQIQSTKVAFAMEATARLTAMGRHPMNIVLGFGTRYLKENFSPWIQSQGGWEKALGVQGQEEVE